MKSVLAGLQVLAKYNDNAEFDAQHDEIFCGGPPPDAVTDDDKKVLEENRWRWSEEFECWRKFV